MISPTHLTLLAAAAAAVFPVLSRAASSSVRHRSSAGTAVNSTTCNGKSYSYNELAGYGIIPGNSTDKFGDTIGGIGSASKYLDIWGTRARRAVSEDMGNDIY